MLCIILFVLAVLGFSPQPDEIQKRLDDGQRPGQIISEWVGGVEDGL